MPAIRVKRLVLAIIVLLAIIAVFSSALIYKAKTPENHSLKLYGNVDLREIQLAFHDEGRIGHLTATEGQTVHRGEILGTLDASRYQLDVELARARTNEARARLADLRAGSRPQEIERIKEEIRAARATLALRKNSFQRVARLAREKVSPPQSLDNARAAYQSANARLRALEASLTLAIAGPRENAVKAAQAALAAAVAGEALANRRLTDTTLLAPVNGIIRTRILEPGDMASPDLPVYTIALTHPVWVRAYVDEPQLGHIHPGQPAWVTSDSYPGWRFKAWIGYISPTAEFTPKTVETTQLRTSLVYQIRVFVCNPRNRLRLGMPTTVHILTDRHDPALHSDPCQLPTKH